VFVCHAILINLDQRQLCSGLLCEQVAVAVGIVKQGSVPKMAPIATPRDSVPKVSAGRVANHTVRRRLTGIEVQLEGVQESLRNSNGILLWVRLSSS
jgi:hypothetical protein